MDIVCRRTRIGTRLAAMLALACGTCGDSGERAGEVNGDRICERYIDAFVDCAWFDSEIDIDKDAEVRECVESIEQARAASSTCGAAMEEYFDCHTRAAQSNCEPDSACGDAIDRECG